MGPTSSKAQPSASLAEYVWLHLACIYGHRFTSAFGDDPSGPAGRAWARTLGGMTREQIDTGIRACRDAPGDDWPSLQAFRDRCLGVPSVGRVMLELKHLDAASPFTLKVRGYLDLFAWRGAGGRERERMVRDAYALAHEALMRGEALPEPQLNLPAPPATPPASASIPPTREERERRVAELLASNPDIADLTARRATRRGGARLHP